MRHAVAADSTTAAILPRSRPKPSLVLDGLKRTLPIVIYCMSNYVLKVSPYLSYHKIVLFIMHRVHLGFNHYPHSAQGPGCSLQLCDASLNVAIVSLGQDHECRDCVFESVRRDSPRPWHNRREVVSAH